jgi:hypothetical protein
MKRQSKERERERKMSDKVKLILLQRLSNRLSYWTYISHFQFVYVYQFSLTLSPSGWLFVSLIFRERKTKNEIGSTHDRPQRASDPYIEMCERVRG